MDQGFDIHRSWIAREFGLREYLPLREEDLDALAAVGTVETFEPDAPLYRQGEPADAAFLIREGEVSLWRDHRHPTVQLARVGSGRMVGDLEMFTAEEYYSTVYAASRVVALRLEREAVMEVLVTHPRLTLRWLVAALQRFEESQQRIAQLLVRSARAKLAVYVLDEGAGNGRVETTHELTARLLGLERATVSRILDRMRQDGLVETGRGWIRILDRDGLVELANGLWPVDGAEVGV